MAERHRAILLLVSLYESILILCGELCQCKGCAEDVKIEKKISVIFCDKLYKALSQTMIIHPGPFSRGSSVNWEFTYFEACKFLFQVVAVVSCLFVVVSTLCLIFSTLPKFQQKDENGVVRKYFKYYYSSYRPL